MKLNERLPVNMNLIHCTARSCHRNLPSGARFKGYKKCSGCPDARIKNKDRPNRLGYWENYDIKKHLDLIQIKRDIT